MLTNILIDKLIPHPNNPRHDLGDLTELAESIKAQGILQNLTVVEAKDDLYTVIIGHRRLAAAKLTDLTEVPCVITEMDEKTQISTMLLENMQRVDLTPYEQAQGFQMCLDLGVTVDELSSKTGFSKKTIKHRLEMMKLNQDTVQKAVHATIDEFIELECIEDLNERNKLLSDIGNRDFKYNIKSAFRQQERKKFNKKFIEALLDIRNDIQVVEKQNWSTHEQVLYLNADTKEELDKAIDEAKKKIKKSNQYVITTEYGVTLCALRKKENTNTKSDEAEKEEERKKRALKREFNTLFKTCFSLRQDFIKELIKGKLSSEIQQHVVNMIAENNLLYKHAIDLYRDKELESLLGYKFCDEIYENYSYKRTLTEDALSKTKNYQSFGVLIASMYSSLERFGFETNTISDDLKYSKNKLFEFIYRFIEGLGYQTSEVEKQLLDGTHELFIKNEPNTK